MKYLASCLALVLLAAPAMAQSIGEKTGINSTLGISLATEDFVKQAAVSDISRSSPVSSRRRGAMPPRNPLPPS